MQPTNPVKRTGALPLALGTISFAVCFAAWGLIAAFAPRFRDTFHLSATQAALLVAVPVLLGSLARLPVGMLADRFGGRLVFSLLMLVCAVPAFLTPMAADLSAIAAWRIFSGIGRIVLRGWCRIRLALVQRGETRQRAGRLWTGQYRPIRGGLPRTAARGFARLAEHLSRHGRHSGRMGGRLLVARAKCAGRSYNRKTIGEMVDLLARERLSWALSAFYFLTFGGFVAFSIYLPSLLRDQFHLQPADAGFRTAGFVVLATLLRPVGGWLSDRIGGARVLSAVFSVVIPFALLLAWPSMLPFTIGALGCAVLMGLGNGAVFKLVPQYFPRETGTVTGLVGAMGGLGGFFPPLLLGFFRDRMGAVWPGFVLLALVSLVMWRVNARVFIPRQNALDLTLPAHLTRTADRVRAAAWATLFTLLLVAAIVVGSRNLENFDPALVIYTFAIIFATWGVVYHYNVWLDKPPTRMYWRRGWELFRSQGILRTQSYACSD